jgi:pimeloyl-ACP methyl ester carboxylesterase
VSGLPRWIGLVLVAAVAAGPAAAQNSPQPEGTAFSLPPQVPAKEALAPLPDARLWYWDTGGDGPPVVLVHPATGSALIWSYQQPAFAKAGYRVIGYSRRSYFNSDPVVKDHPGVASQDLHNLVEFLGLRKFHVVGSAAGGGIAADYAVSHPDRLLSLVISSNPAGLSSGAIAKLYDSLRPKGLADLPADFRELSASYRAANPAGAKFWLDLEHKAIISRPFRQPAANEISEATLAALKVPTLLITGEADLFSPPALIRMVAAQIPSSEVAVMREAGHSSYWEQPDAFNRAVLEFIARHPK